MHVVVYSYFFVTPVSVFSSFYDYHSDTHRMKKKFKLVKKQTQTTAHKTIGYFQIPHYTLYFLPRTSKFITEDLKIENSCYILKKSCSNGRWFLSSMKLHKNALTVTKQWKQRSFSCSESVVSYMKQMPYKTVQQKVWNVKNWLNKKKSFYTQLKSNDQEDSLIFHTTTRKKYQKTSRNLQTLFVTQ